MTNSPADLLEIRHYLEVVTGLAPVALGIQHYAPDGGGYHEGVDLLAAGGRAATDYSVRESARDRAGLSTDASAIDIDENMRQGRAWFHGTFTPALVAACVRRDPRAVDVREIIYSLDGKNVKRWDALGIRSTGDSSHLTHDHVSFFRDSAGRRARSDNFLGLLREIFEGKVTSMASEWHVGEGTGSALTQGPKTPKMDKAWLPDSISGQQRDTGLAHAWHAAARAAQAVEHETFGLAELHAKVDALAAGGIDQATLAAALKAALADPDVRALLVATAREGANLAEDS